MSVVDIIRSKSLVDYIQGMHPSDELEYQPDDTWRCKCPIHNGTNNSSFAIYPNNRFYCFSCQTSGDLITYVMCRNNLMFFQSIEFLADKYSINLDTDESYQKQKDIARRNEKKCREYEGNLKIVYEYLRKDRGLSDEIIRSHRLGYCTDEYHPNTLTIPMRDLYGRLVAFGYRYFDIMPKYKNSSNNDLFKKGEYLFNVDIAARIVPKTKKLYVVEGHIDAMSIEQQGGASVAYCGITFTREHVLLIKQITERIDGVTIVLVPDNDGKASKFIERGRFLFSEHYREANVRVMLIN